MGEAVIEALAILIYLYLISVLCLAGLGVSAVLYTIILKISGGL